MKIAAEERIGTRTHIITAVHVEVDIPPGEEAPDTNTSISKLPLVGSYKNGVLKSMCSVSPKAQG